MKTWKFQLLRLAFSLVVGALVNACHGPAVSKYEHAQKSIALLETGHGYGTGFVVQRSNPNGNTRLFLFAAAHVVHHVNTVKVRQIIRFENQKVGETAFTATVIARDEAFDLALLLLEAPPGYFEPVEFDSHDILPVGSPVYHCGNFHGPNYEGSVSTGVISQLGVHPDLSGWPWTIPLDQTTSIVLPGSSGGPLFCDSDNAVCGLVVGMVTPGVEFFVPLRTMRSFAVVRDVRWAIDSGRCPSDGQLVRLAESAFYKSPPLPSPPAPKADIVVTPKKVARKPGIKHSL